MAHNFIVFIHLAAIVLAVVELGLTAYVVSAFQYAGRNYAPSTASFMLFNAVWSILVLAYIGVAPLYLTRLFHRTAALALESVTMIFWFAGSIALAVHVGGPYDCRGSAFCGSVQAAIAFGFFLWALFCALVVVDTMEALRSRGHRTKVNVGA